MRWRDNADGCDLSRTGQGGCVLTAPTNALPPRGALRTAQPTVSMELPVTTLFKRQFGHKPPHVVQAPGRLELLGNHTDYNAGLVMALAVDKYVYVAATPRTDGKVKLIAAAFPE